MSYVYAADNFNTNGNFISTADVLNWLPAGDDFHPVSSTSSGQINWDDPLLYTMPLTNSQIEAFTNEIAATNMPPNISTHPELPPARTPSPQPFETSTHNKGSPSAAEEALPDTGREIPKSLHEANMSSWAARNPTRAIIHPRMPPHQLTDAQKASQKIKRDQKIERARCLHDVVAEFLDAQKTQIEALLQAHHITPKQLNDMISSRTHYRTSHKSQLTNALVHAKAKEMNADQPIGSRYSLAELCEMVATDPQMKHLTREEKEAYIAALEEHWERESVSVWANNLAAAQDVVATMDRIVKELDDLQVWTGVYGTLFVVRGHINDTIQSMMHGTDNSEDFWEDVYKHPIADFLRQYKQWACTQNQNLNERDSLGAVRKQVCKMILWGLVAMTGKKDIAMNYSNYETSIIGTYGVQLVGWPHGVKFVNPSNIGTVGDIRKLQDALKAHTCYWAVLSAAEVKTHASELDTHCSAGEAIWKP